MLRTKSKSNFLSAARAQKPVTFPFMRSTRRHFSTWTRIVTVPNHGKFYSAATTVYIYQDSKLLWLAMAVVHVGSPHDFTNLFHQFSRSFQMAFFCPIISYIGIFYTVLISIIENVWKRFGNWDSWNYLMSRAGC